MIAALVQKDMKLFFRNQFFALITGLGLVFYILIYFLMPATIDQTLPLALYVEDSASSISLGDGLTVSTFDSQEALIQAVENGDYTAGLALPAAATTAISQGEPVTLNAYYAPGTAPEVRDSINSVLTARLNALTAAPDAPRTDVSMVTEVLGQQTDAPIPMRDRILPMLVLSVLAVEIMGLATLIVEEVEHGTARALLTTPLGTPQFFTSKAIMGVGLAFVQVFIIVALTGKLATMPLLLLATLLLGCLLITGIGFLIAAVAKDMMSVIGWGMLVLVVLILPSISLMFPAIGSGWMDYIPSFYLVDTLHRTMNFGASWGDVSTNLLTLLVMSVGILLIGSVALRRRLQ